MFFDPHFAIFPLLAWLFGFASHGEFLDGAQALNEVKKKVFLRVARWVRLLSSLYWHESNDYEANDMRKSVFPIPMGEWMEQTSLLDQWRGVPRLNHPRCHWSRRLAYAMAADCLGNSN